MLLSRLIAIALIGLGLLATARAQEPFGQERFEAGRRLVRLEAAWETCSDPAARAFAVRQGQVLFGHFFQGKLREVAQALDEAWLALRANRPIAPQPWMASLSLQLNKWCLDPNQEPLIWELAPFYPSEAVPDDVVWVLKLDRIGDPDVELQSKQRGNGPFELGLESLPDGDYRLQVHVGTPQTRFEAVVREARLSVLRQRDLLADELENQSAVLSAEREGFERSLYLELSKEMRRQAEGAVPELGGSVFRRTQWLARWRDQKIAGLPAPPPAEDGEYWLNWPTPAGVMHVRARHPDPTDPEPRPLVIAVHGAGGSENMFFESYGVGRLARECVRRGWIFAAPRANPLNMAEVVPETLALANRLWSIEPGQVMLVGHSLGALTVGGAAAMQPEAYGGVAMLSGAGGFAKPRALAALPIFLAVGQQDFALEQVRELGRRLKAAEHPDHRVIEYENVGHILVFSESTDQLLDFLRDCIKDRVPPQSSAKSE